MIQLRFIPFNIMRASGVGLTALTAATLSIPAQAQTTPNVTTTSLFGQVTGGSTVGSTFVQCTATTLNTCGNHAAMRPLTAKEVELLMGANTSTNGYSSHGSCNTAGCNVSATPPSSAPPTSDPITSQPTGGGWTAPNNTQQQQDIKCAEIYGNTKPNPNFKETFTNLYGWSSKSAITGLTNAHATTETDNAPSKVPAGGESWQIVQATTWFDSPTPYTEIYMYAYRNPDDIIGTLVHEWYHQNNDGPNESAATESSNESKAQAAGAAAKAAFDADAGAKCSG